MKINKFIFPFKGYRIALLKKFFMKNVGEKKKNNGRRKVLLELFKRFNGICCYCKNKTILPASGIDGVSTDETATIEHIYSNLDIRRLLFRRNEKIKLACHKCNNSRANAEQDAVNYGFDYFNQHENLLVNLLQTL